MSQLTSHFYNFWRRAYNPTFIQDLNTVHPYAAVQADTVRMCRSGDSAGDIRHQLRSDIAEAPFGAAPYTLVLYDIAIQFRIWTKTKAAMRYKICLLYTSDAADD